MPSDFDNAKFEAALQMALDKEKHDYPAVIGGMYVASGTDMPLVSPVDDTIIFGTLQEPEEGTTAVAAEKADEAFATWSKTSPAERASVISKVAEDVRTKRYQLAAELLLGTGMVRKEAVAEVDRLIEVLDKAAADAETVKGRPTGVWAVIALNSSPLASAVGYAAAAIAAGNTVVISPSGSCPTPVYTLYRMFEKAGLPGGVMNIVSDRLDRYVTALSDDQNVSGVVASGCGKAMDELMFVPVDEGLGFVNEVKGMTPIIVANPSDMKRAAADVLESAFSYCGQHLYSTSKVIVLAEDERDFTKALVERAKDFSVDDPGEESAACGPLMSDETEKRFLKFIKEEENFLLFGGKRVRKEYTSNGLYYTPAIFTGLDAEDDNLYVDQGLPVLCIRVVATVDDAIADLMETDCGLAVGVMSRDASTINRVKAEAGDMQVFVNRSSLSLVPAVKATVDNFVE